MKKEEQIRMLLHPEDYTDEQLDQMLDETDVKVPDTNEEWEEFRRKREEGRRKRLPLLKIAAMFVGVLMLSGIAFATIHIVSHRAGGEDNQRNRSIIGSQTTITQPVPVILPDTIPQPRIFENVPLDEIITEMALYYNKVVDIQNGQAHELRLYYKWDRQDDIGSIVEDLNHFDHVTLAVEGDRLTVKP